MCRGSSFAPVSARHADAEVACLEAPTPEGQGYWGPGYWRLPVSAPSAAVTDPRISNLGHFRCSQKSFDSLDSASFTMVQRVSAGINGDIFKYRWLRGDNESCVAVKKLRNRALTQLENTETDERVIHTNSRQFISLNNEDALTEIGVLSYLAKQQDMSEYLLKMLGIYKDTHFTWLVTELAEGGELFDVAASGNIGEKQIKEYAWQMLQACDYLHRHCIGHRDISLENVLLKDGNVRLMDFGMAVCSHSSSGTPLRFFREVGKSFYRAPECYVPEEDEVAVTAPLESRPGDVIIAKVHPNFLCQVRLQDGAVPGRSGLADIWGYAALPADVFALAVCVFILAFQCPAWEAARLSNRHFAHYYNCEEDRLDSQRKFFGKGEVLSPEAMSLLTGMLQVDPNKRPPTNVCLEHPWFGGMVK